jgi:hypothetical protein
MEDIFKMNVPLDKETFWLTGICFVRMLSVQMCIYDKISFTVHVFLSIAIIIIDFIIL